MSEGIGPTKNKSKQRHKGGGGLVKNEMTLTGQLVVSQIEYRELL